MNSPLAVIMSVFNGAQYLPRCIESVLNQTFRDFDFLILDDGSTDKSFEIVQSYQDSRITAIRNHINVGLTASLNRLLSLVKSPLVARIDSDDWAQVDRFAMQVSALEKMKDVDVLGAGGLLVDEVDQIIGQVDFPLDSESLFGAFFFGNSIRHSSVMMRRTVFDRFGLYDEKLRCAQDFNLWCRVLSGGGKVANLSEHLMFFREHPRSVGVVMKVSQRIARNEILKDFYVRNLHWKPFGSFFTILGEIYSIKEHELTFVERHVLQWCLVKLRRKSQLRFGLESPTFRFMENHIRYLLENYVQ